MQLQDSLSDRDSTPGPRLRQSSGRPPSTHLQSGSNSENLLPPCLARPGPHHTPKAALHKAGQPQVEPECNGVAECFIRTLKEERIHLHDFETLEEAREVIGAFIERYNNGWLLQRHGYLTPARAREKLSRSVA